MASFRTGGPPGVMTNIITPVPVVDNTLGTIETATANSNIETNTTESMLFLFGKFYPPSSFSSSRLAYFVSLRFLFECFLRVHSQ